MTPIFLLLESDYILITFQQTGSPSYFLRYEQLKPKHRVFLLGFSVAKVTYYVTITIASCLETIVALYIPLTNRV